MRDDVEGTWNGTRARTVGGRWRREGPGEKAKWRTSRMTMMEKNLEDEVKASRTSWCPC